MKKKVRTEVQGSGYKEYNKEDYRETKNNNSMLKSRTASPLQVSRSRDELLYGDKIEVPRGYTDRYDQDRIYMEGRRKISFNERGSQSGDYGNIMHNANKDKEINRLTQVVILTKENMELNFYNRWRIWHKVWEEVKIQWQVNQEEIYIFNF